MTKSELQHKARLINEAWQGVRGDVPTLHIYLDKETFKAIHKECGEPQMYEPTPTLSDYYFFLTIDDVRFCINFKPEKTITYESL
jgi:hypothetical protein